MREHHVIDEQIRVGPARWTLLKPHLYMQNLLRAADSVRRDGWLAAPMGRDCFPLVDTRDVGAAAAIVLGNPVAHAGQVYALTGPAAHSYDEVATALSVVAGRAVTYEPVLPQARETLLLAAGIPGWRAAPSEDRGQLTEGDLPYPFQQTNMPMFGRFPSVP